MEKSSLLYTKAQHEKSSTTRDIGVLPHARDHGFLKYADYGRSFIIFIFKTV